MTKEKIPKTPVMTNNDEEQENETYISFYGGILSTPKYQGIVIDVGSGALTAGMLTEAAHKARTMQFSPQTGIFSAAAIKCWQETEEERKIKEKFDNSPVGKMLK
jgi:hypothetical protein